MDEEVKFFTEGLGMKVVRQREVNGARNVFVAYGDESLQSKDGGEGRGELRAALSGVDSTSWCQHRLPVGCVRCYTPLTGFRSSITPQGKQQ